MTAPVPDRRTGGAAVAGGLLLAASVAAELVHPVQDPDGSVVSTRPVRRLPRRCGPWVPPRSSSRSSGSGAPPGCPRVGRAGAVVSLAGAGLLLAFGVVVVASALATGAPLEASFLAFAVGLLLLAVGAVLLGLGLRRSGAVGGWWTALLVAGGRRAGRAARRAVARPRACSSSSRAWVPLGVGRCGAAAGRRTASRRPSADRPGEHPGRPGTRPWPAGRRGTVVVRGSTEDGRRGRGTARAADGAATEPSDGSTVVVLDDRLVEALRSALDRPVTASRPDRPGSPSARAAVDRLTAPGGGGPPPHGRGVVQRGDRAAPVRLSATVKCHVAQVLRKLGVRDRVQAVVAAFRGGLCCQLTNLPAARDRAPCPPGARAQHRRRRQRHLPERTSPCRRQPSPDAATAGLVGGALWTLLPVAWALRRPRGRPVRHASPGSPSPPPTGSSRSLAPLLIVVGLVALRRALGAAPAGSGAAGVGRRGGRDWRPWPSASASRSPR